VTQGVQSTTWTLVDSPVGELLLAAERNALTGIFFARHRDGTDYRPAQARSGRRQDDEPLLVTAATQLREYFARERRLFDLPLAPQGSGFQKRVWQALLAIGYGETASYGDVARRLNLLPSASRAVGTANGSNPISIVIPCHRVIGADGSLTGYGGGLERKRFLLDLERDLLF
jgi:methylated-DNA-[protein]-cysteine S-methyltransferase